MVVLFLVAHLYIHSSRKPSKKIAKSVFGRISSKTEGRKKPMQKKKKKITDTVKIHRMFQKFLVWEKD